MGLVRRQNWRWGDGFGKRRMDQLQAFIGHCDRSMHVHAVDHCIVVRQKRRDIPVSIFKHRVVFPTETVVNGEPRSDFPIVLTVERVGSPVRVSIGIDDVGNVRTARNSEQECCKRIPNHRASDGVGEHVASQPPAIEHGSVKRCEVPEVTADFNGVLPV